MTGAQYSTIERAVLHKLAESTGKTLDTLYAALVHQLGLTQRFFQHGGFGDLRVVNFHEDVKTFAAWPPQHFSDVSIEWKRIRDGTFNKSKYTVFQGQFRTPCTARAYDALPQESRTAHVQWIAPHEPAPDSPTVITLAATGDHGYLRREHLCLPLVANGVGSIALESPFYGKRKPPDQQGAKLRRVSDLLLLGRATIEESLFLLQWLGQRGHQRLGVSGLSMGGVHASMVASMYPLPVALTPLLAPRSAAGSYCHGALFHATAWDRLLRDTQGGRENDIVAAVEAAARASERMAPARVDLMKRRKEECNTFERGSSNNNMPSSTNNSTMNIASWQWKQVGQWVTSWSSGFEAALQRVRNVQAQTNDGGRQEHEEARRVVAVELLHTVLETFTDATRFPRPCRPDAAILVAATEDAYVSPQSVLDLHKHLPGSEVRWVPGGHVSSFLLHHPTFRSAILDSLERLGP